MTSHDVVARVRRCLGIKKVGHAGTLDPMATGVLPVCVGHATRLLEYFPTGKSYEMDIVLGISTDTLDADGQIECQQPADEVAALGITVERLQTLADAMVGTIEQRIPVYSAKKVNGKKLYEMARAGMTIEAPTKTVTINTLQVVSLQSNEAGYPVATVQVDCGTGTFMRAIARDLAEQLGCGAHLSRLVRTRHGQFLLNDSIELDALAAVATPVLLGQSPLSYLNVPAIHLALAESMVALCHGKNLLQRELEDMEPNVLDQLKQQSIHNNHTVLVRCEQSHSLVLAHWKNHALKPHKVLHDVLPTIVGL